MSVSVLLEIAGAVFDPAESNNAPVIVSPDFATAPMLDSVDAALFDPVPPSPIDTFVVICCLLNYAAT